MKYIDIVKNEINKYKENELIFANKLYKQKFFRKIPEPTFYKIIERMYKLGELMKLAKGTYYIPKQSKYGVVPISDEEIISAFTKNNTGVVIGYKMYNNLNLTTQISKKIDIYSSEIVEYKKVFRNVIVHQVNLNYNKKIIEMINALEVLKNFDEIEDLNYLKFIDFARDFSLNYDEKIFEKVHREIKYQKSTIAFMREILNFYNINNNLNLYLSNLSNYNYLKMEEIYEIARNA